jgi:hypothetical protein
VPAWADPVCELPGGVQPDVDQVVVALPEHDADHLSTEAIHGPKSMTRS